MVVDRFDLNPPVDIRALVERFADLDYCDWPFDCDGIAILSPPQPKIFIKADQAPRRERFTLAHELGHVIIPWHVNEIDCRPVDTQETMSDETYLGMHNEAEANAFASRVLVPDRFVSGFNHQYASVDEILQKLEIADISAAAGVLAISRALLPGYVFIVPDLKRPVRSEGTAYVANISDLRRLAIKSGASTHQGKEVHWFQMAEDIAPSEAITSRRAASDALAKVADSRNGRRTGVNVVGVVNGVIGAAKTRTRGLSVSTCLGYLHYRCIAKPELVPICHDGTFLDYLSFKARELIN